MVAAPVLYGVMLRRPNPRRRPCDDPIGTTRPARGRSLARAVATCLALLGAGCGGSEAEPPVDGLEGVASLSPAITTTLLDLGVPATDIVGRTPWCRGVDEAPVIGTLEGVDAELLVQVRPATVLHQPPATGTDPVLLGLRDRVGFTLVGGRLDGVADVLALLDEIGTLELGDPDRLATRRRALEEIAAVGDAQGASAAIVHSVDPVGVAGEDTFLGELVRAIGFRNVAGPGGWREWSIETLLRAAPERVIVVATSSEGGERMHATLSGLEWSGPTSIMVLVEPDAFEPSSRMPDVLEAMRGLVPQEASAASAGSVVPDA